MTVAFRIYVAVAALVAALALSLAGWETLLGARAHWNAVAALLVLGFASEASYLRLRVGQADTQSSVSFVPFIASYLLLDAGWAASIAGASMLLVEVFVRRKPPLRILFNTSQMVVSVVSAAWVYSALGGAPSLQAFQFRPAALAASVVTYFGINSTAVTLAVVLDLRQRLWAAWRRIAGVSLLYDLLASALAPALAWAYVTWQITGMVALILPLYIVRHMYQVALQLEQVNRDLLELMVKAIEARDPYTSGHSQRVSQLSAALARDIGLGAKHVDQITTAALLHDVGKIHEEYAALLRKDGRLDSTEQALMQTHSLRSAELVSTISAFRGAITETVKHHHENYDGSGYPFGLAGDAIPIGSRIIMIADTVDAMTTDRPYRRALSYERVSQELAEYAGKQFDPRLVDAFLSSPAVRGILQPRMPSATSTEAVPMPLSMLPAGVWRRREPAKPIA